MRRLNTLREQLEYLKAHSKKRKIKTQEIINDLKKSEKKLESFNDETTYHTIEMLTKKKTSLDGFLWQKELVEQYNFSVAILGMLDYKIEYYRNEVIENTEYFDAEKLQKAKKKYQKYQQLRAEAFLLYQHATSKNELPIIKRALSKSPSYEYFGEVYEDFAINHYQLELQKALLEAYTKGYTTSSKVNVNEIFEAYRIYATKLIKHKQNNRRRIDEIKNQKQKTHQN